MCGNSALALVKNSFQNENMLKNKKHAAGERLYIKVPS